MEVSEQAKPTVREKDNSKEYYRRWCFTHSEHIRQYKRQWRILHRDTVNQNRRQWRDEHRKAGLCCQCNRPVLPGRVLCSFHTQYDACRAFIYRTEHPTYQAERAQRRYQQLISRGKCPSCGRPMDDENRYCCDCLARKSGATARVIRGGIDVPYYYDLTK